MFDLDHPVYLFIMIEIAKLGETLDNDQGVLMTTGTWRMATVRPTQFMSAGIVRIPE